MNRRHFLKLSGSTLCFLGGGAIPALRVRRVQAVSPKRARRRPANLVEQALQLPRGEAMRRLRALIDHADPNVRLEALATLATSGDPRLAELARRRALEDEDDRVADLAAKILDSASR